MQIKIFWEWDNANELLNRINLSVDELWLSDFIKVISTANKEDLWNDIEVTKTPALIIEEESIDFRDIIFEWIVPEVDEIKSMFISIIGWGEWWWCSWGSCWSGCSC